MMSLSVCTLRLKCGCVKYSLGHKLFQIIRLSVHTFGVEFFKFQLRSSKK